MLKPFGQLCLRGPSFAKPTCHLAHGPCGHVKFGRMRCLSLIVFYNAVGGHGNVNLHDRFLCSLFPPSFQERNKCNQISVTFYSQNTCPRENTFETHQPGKNIEAVKTHYAMNSLRNGTTHRNGVTCASTLN